jgi:hypothetical protein
MEVLAKTPQGGDGRVYTAATGHGAILKCRAGCHDLLEQFPMLGQNVAQNDRVGAVDRCHGG